MSGKWLELLKEMAPNVTRVLVMFDSISVSDAEFAKAAEKPAPSFGLQFAAASVSRFVGGDPQPKSARVDTCIKLWVEIRFYADRNGLSGSGHVGRLELVAIAGEHTHVTPRRNRTVVSCENS
jgi:hypothetical protein